MRDERIGVDGYRLDIARRTASSISAMIPGRTRRRRRRGSRSMRNSERVLHRGRHGVNRNISMMAVSSPTVTSVSEGHGPSGCTSVQHQLRRPHHMITASMYCCEHGMSTPSFAGKYMIRVRLAAHRCALASTSFIANVFGEDVVNFCPKNVGGR